MQELEIEKRFLVLEEKIEELMGVVIADSKKMMNDVYIPNGDAHKDLRLRQKNDEFVITRKRPLVEGDSTKMMETSIPLSREEFFALAAGIESNVEKTRYIVNVSGWQGELDIFSGRHAGLAVLEFEFKSDEDLEDFNSNQQLGLIDITNEEWLAGGRLAEIDGNELKKKLEAFLG